MRLIESLINLIISENISGGSTDYSVTVFLPTLGFHFFVLKIDKKVISVAKKFSEQIFEQNT